MDFNETMKLAAYHRLLSALAGLIGGSIALLGLWIGFLDVLRSWYGSFPALSVSPLTDVMGALGLGFTVLGLAIWWTAATAVNHHVRAIAFRRHIEDELDMQRVKSEILSVMDGRLEDLHRTIRNQ